MTSIKAKLSLFYKDKISLNTLILCNNMERQTQNNIKQGDLTIYLKFKEGIKEQRYKAYFIELEGGLK